MSGASGSNGCSVRTGSSVDYYPQVYRPPNTALGPPHPSNSVENLDHDNNGRRVVDGGSFTRVETGRWSQQEHDIFLDGLR